jgi:hypothetical protein
MAIGATTTSCGTVALYGPFFPLFFADNRATVFTLSKTFEMTCGHPTLPYEQNEIIVKHALEYIKRSEMFIVV